MLQRSPAGQSNEIRNDSFHTCLLAESGWKRHLIKSCRGFLRKERGWPHAGVFSCFQWVQYVSNTCGHENMRRGWNVFVLSSEQNAFVAKSGLNSQELRQLLLCSSFQHYSSLLFHVVYVCVRASSCVCVCVCVCVCQCQGWTVITA